MPPPPIHVTGRPPRLAHPCGRAKWWCACVVRQQGGGVRVEPRARRMHACVRPLLLAAWRTNGSPCYYCIRCRRYGACVVIWAAAEAAGAACWQRARLHTPSCVRRAAASAAACRPDTPPAACCGCVLAHTCRPRAAGPGRTWPGSPACTRKQQRRTSVAVGAGARGWKDLPQLRCFLLAVGDQRRSRCGRLAGPATCIAHLALWCAGARQLPLVASNTLLGCEKRESEAEAICDNQLEPESNLSASGSQQSFLLFACEVFHLRRLMHKGEEKLLKCY